jgi:hypothetical protein
MRLSVHPKLRRDGTVPWRTGKLGADIGYLCSGVIVLEVLAPAITIHEGVLAGHYVGASVGAAVGVGGGINVLVGEMRSSVSLQPISVEGDIGRLLGRRNFSELGARLV